MSHGRRHKSCMVEVSEVSKASFSCGLVNESTDVFLCTVMRRMKNSIVFNVFLYEFTLEPSYTIFKRNPIRRAILTNMRLTKFINDMYDVFFNLPTFLFLERLGKPQ